MKPGEEPRCGRREDLASEYCAMDEGMKVRQGEEKAKG
jgi:hypothetical protein